MFTNFFFSTVFGFRCFKTFYFSSNFGSKLLLTLIYMLPVSYTHLDVYKRQGYEEVQHLRMESVDTAAPTQSVSDQTGQ